MKTRLLILGLLLSGPLMAVENPWVKLKVGMPDSVALDLLGEPLFSTRGHGFFTWTYDGGAELLLLVDGRVMGWTSPAEAASTARSRDIWSSQPAGKYYATMHAALPKPLPRQSPAAADPGEILRAGKGQGFEEYYTSGRTML